MANIVLVHGAWHGAWCYRDCARALRAAGHEVFTPTLSGSGEYFHSATGGVTLEHHVRDILGVFEVEELSDAVLVGHSYGGMVITGVADRIPEKIRHLIYLDAFVPENGDSLNGLLPRALAPEIARAYLNGFHGSASVDHSMMMSPIPAAMFGIKAENQAWVDRRCTPQSLATFEMPLFIGQAGAALPKLYVLADAWDPSPFRYFAAKLENAGSWKVVKLPSSHDLMIDMPLEVAELIRTVADERDRHHPTDHVEA
jgi:pimeloyl-ACP methyl ester carboxylesterase